METDQFDATLGGTEHLPYLANSLKFSASRSIEIAAMTESILRPSKTKLVFQTLPVHMRRRVMSHNCKRLPRKLRLGHMEQLKKSGLPPKQKRPSRKYRRRPANLLEEYNRRQRRNKWLETHIWHAKRFHMIERWGHKLPFAPCDKAFRACYRATSAHCLLQDVSYLTPIQIKGPLHQLKQIVSKVTNTVTGLGLAAKAFISGSREGSTHLYTPDEYPYNYIGSVSFMWEVIDGTEHKLWMFVHPSQSQQLFNILNDLVSSVNANSDSEIPIKRRKICELPIDSVQVTLMADMLNRFRLTGPNSHAVLVKTLKCIDDPRKIKEDKWFSQCNINLKIEENYQFWNNLKLACSPSQLSPHMILGFIVRDPRLSRPGKRTKAKLDTSEQIDLYSLLNVPELAAKSPLWNPSITEVIKKYKLSNSQYIEHITNTQLVPGEVYEEDPKLQSVPIVLIQRPGSQDSACKKLGYGCGWDVIVPAGYGLPFWQTFVMFGARAGGLRETESLAFEMGKCYLPPDSLAGTEEEKRLALELKDKYFRRPPSKRVNYLKLGIMSPFICPWKILLQDWSENDVDKFYVLRDKVLLGQLKDCLDNKKNIPLLSNSMQCLVPIYLKMKKKGNLKRHAIVCLPKLEDLSNANTPLEPHHTDPNEKLRKQLRAEHRKCIRQMRRKHKKLKKKGLRKPSTSPKQSKHEPSKYVMKMRQLWVPPNIETVRHSCSREIIGFLSQGAFSFSEAKSCGVGYIAYNALRELLARKCNTVLVRNTSSRKYRMSTIQIIKH